MEKVDSAEGSLLGVCFVRQSYHGQVTSPPRGKKVPERMDVPKFYKQML